MKNVSPLCIALLLLIVGCSSDKDSSIDSKNKEYTVNLGLNLELNGSYSQLKSTSSNTDVYGIQVYSMTNIQNSTSNYTYYAYGLFDDLSKMNINLLSGYKYKFVVTLIKDAKDIILQDQYGGFYYPLSIEASQASVGYILNSFTIATNAYLDLTSSLTDLKSTSSRFSRPAVDRFYGEISDFVPSDTQTSASVLLKRVAYGVSFTANGLTDGKLVIQMKDAPDITILATNNPTSFQSTYTCENITDAWRYQETATSVYSETVPVSISWIKSSGVTVPLANTQIVLERNKLATFTITVQDESATKGITITQTEGDLSTGHNYTIQNGAVTQTN